MVNRIALAGLILFVLTSCSSSTLFVPLVGPFTGNLFVDEMPVGAMTLTAADGLLGGTGTLTHNAQPVTVSISATIDGYTISGTISNASLGSGNLVGTFTDEDTMSGEFNYQDNGGISITTGTWTAAIEPAD